MSLKVYTLKNCDTCKKALKWLDDKNVTYTNHDVRADGLSNQDVSEIVGSLGWELVLNRRSTTWRGLEDSDKADLDNQKAISLILANPTLMKRPVFTDGNNYVAGFDAKAQDAISKLI